MKSKNEPCMNAEFSLPGTYEKIKNKKSGINFIIEFPWRIANGCIVKIFNNDNTAFRESIVLASYTNLVNSSKHIVEMELV